MNEEHDASGLRCDVVVQLTCSRTGALEKSKQYRSTEISTAVDNDGTKGLAVGAKVLNFLAQGYRLRAPSLIAKFAHEGKLTIKLPAANMLVFVSKANPSELREWLAKLAPFLAVAAPALAAASSNYASGSNRFGAPLGALSAARSNVRAREEETTTGAKRAKAAGGEGGVKLSDEQQAVVERVLAGESVFFTGAAGTGKSLVLRAIVEALPGHCTAVTAMTASAASLIGGQTLHAFAGIGNGERPLSQLIESAKKRALQVWRRTNTLIVDEISMASAELLDKLEAVARNLRNSDLPFGGMQLVFCGDFFQLPPVSRREGPPAHYAFQSRAWVRSSLQTVELIKIWRQSDAELIEMLTEVRKGRVSAKSLRVLAACERPPDHTSLAPGVRPTKLYTHRADCEEINQQQLAALEGKSVVIRAADSGTGLFCSNSGELLSGCVAKAALELKEGAQVLLLKSIAPNDGLVNGARGVVVRFERGLPVVRFVCGVERVIERQPFLIVSGGRVVAVRSQVPLALGWAISVHRSQGLSLDLLEVTLDRAFEYGQAYTALSRCRTLAGLHVRAFDPSAVKAHPDVLDFMERMAVEAREGARAAMQSQPQSP